MCVWIEILEREFRFIFTIIQNIIIVIRRAIFYFREIIYVGFLLPAVHSSCIFCSHFSSFFFIFNLFCQELMSFGATLDNITWARMHHQYVNCMQHEQQQNECTDQYLAVRALTTVSESCCVAVAVPPHLCGWRIAFHIYSLQNCFFMHSTGGMMLVIFGIIKCHGIEQIVQLIGGA